MEAIDARGLSCPQPVILARRALLAEANDVTVIVDNDIARDNVVGMAKKEGFATRVEPRADGIYLHLARQAQAATQAESRAAEGPTVVLLASNTMGRGPEELGTVLVRVFLHTINEVSPLPDSVILLNTGVQLAVKGSPLVEDFKALVEQGVNLLACGTCLGYFGLTESLAVGTVSNMYTIAETLLRAGKVVSL